MELGNGSGFSFASGHWAIAVADCVPIVAIEPADALRPGAVVAKHIATKTENTSRRDLIELLTVDLLPNRVPLAASTALGAHL
jgi:hypothetical protein